MPPPSMSGGGHHHHHHPRGYHGQQFHHRPNFNKNFHTPFRPFHKNPNQILDPDFDGKKLRKSSMRKTVDYNAAVINALEVWKRRIGLDFY